MTKGNGKVGLNWIYTAVAAVLFVGLFVTTFFHGQKQTEQSGYSVVILGDSILGLCRDESSVAVQLETLLDKPVFNGAFGGTSMAMQQSGDYSADLLSMVSLSKAMAAHDFGVQQTIRSRKEVTSYFEDTIDALEQVDFRDTEILLVCFGVNDYHAGVPLNNPKDSKDIYTYAGALRESLDTLQKEYPDMRIVLVTSTYAWYLANDMTCEEYVIGGNRLEDYVDQTIAVAKEYDVEVIDLYHDLYTHDKWEDWEVYTEDGLHPNEYGRTLLARTIAEALSEE